MKNQQLILIALTLSLAASQAFAFHADIFVTRKDGALVTGRGADDPESEEVPQVGTRFHVNDIAGIAPFVDYNPGISAEDSLDSFFVGGTYQPLPGNRSVGFNIKSFRIENGPAANLFYWNGSGSVTFQPVTNLNDRLEVRTGAGSAIATGAAADVAGFDFTMTDSTGYIHSHLIFDFDVDNTASTPASTGIFLTALEFNMNLVGDMTREIARPHYLAWFNGPPGALKTSAMAVADSYLADNFAGLRLQGDVSPLGDDDLPDDLVDVADIDTLMAAINAGSQDLLFDLNGDSLVNVNDTTALFEMLDTQYGDANLDGMVNPADLDLWRANYGTSGGWAAGDFNGSGRIDGRDFLIWQRHAGFGSSQLSILHSVPEPSSIIVIIFAGFELFTRRPFQHRIY